MEDRSVDLWVSGHVLENLDVRMMSWWSVLIIILR